MTALEIPAAAETRTVTGKARSRGWRVLHACEHARLVLPVAEAQVAAGLQPYLVTPQSAGTAEVCLSAGAPEPGRPLTLVRAWQDARQWRKSILECDPENSADLVHAHSFAAGMAAVRSCSCVVYDFGAAVEETAGSAGQCEPCSWMARSFRAAEQFLLSRAAAVIVHCHGMREAALERGAPSRSIFLIPDPLLVEDDLPALLQLGRKYGEAYRYAASRRKTGSKGPGLPVLQPLANCA